MKMPLQSYDEDGVTSFNVQHLHVVLGIENVIILPAYTHSPVQLNTCFFLKLSPELIAFLHHLCVEIFLIGFPYDPGLAMRAPSGVGQNKLGEKGHMCIAMFK